PRQRYSSALALAEDLRRFRSGQRIQARPVGNTQRLWLWCRRNPPAAVRVAALSFALLAGAGLALHWTKQAEQRAVRAEQRLGEAIREMRQVSLDQFSLEARTPPVAYGRS